MAKSKDRIANDLYGEDYDYLLPGEKAAVTRAWKAQGVEAAPATGAVRAKICRVGVNGVKECALPRGATVADLLDQSGVELDEDKEAVMEESTGQKVDLDTEVKHGETYHITTEIKSA